MTLTSEYIAEEIAPRFSLALQAERYREEVYLANHSLGRPLDKLSQDVHAAIELWYARMDDCWEDDDAWTAEQDLWRSNIARLLGLPSYDLVVPKTSAAQGLRAVLNALTENWPLNIVTTTGEFDSIDFVLKTYAHKGVANVTWVPPTADDNGVPLFEADKIAEAITENTHLVVFSRVFYSTSQILQGFDKVVQRAHDNGALVVCDVYHAAGVIPLDMTTEGYDFAIGGSYKYLRGGPGVGYLAIHPKTIEKGLRTLDTGWFAKADHFDFQRPNEPKVKPRADGWLEATPLVLAPYQGKSGLEFVIEIGVENLRKYQVQQLQSLRETFKELGLNMHTPSNPSSYGAFALLLHEDAPQVRKHLKCKGVNVDSRLKAVRFGPDLLNTKEEFMKAAQVVRSVV